MYIYFNLSPLTGSVAARTVKGFLFLVMSQEQLEFEYQQLLAQNKWLLDKLTSYLNSKRKALKTKDKRDFAIMNNIEKELISVVNPKQESQYKLDWLAQ